MKKDSPVIQISTSTPLEKISSLQRKLAPGDLVIVHSDPPFCREIEGLARLISRIENYPPLLGFERWKVRFQGDWRVVDRWIKTRD